MRNPLRHIFSVLLILIFFIVIPQCGTKQKQAEEITVHDQLCEILNEHSLNTWYPLVIDTINGGYYSNFDYQWTKQPRQYKFIVTQARHIWSLSKALEHYPERKIYQQYAYNGFHFLKEKMWDHELGGFFQMVDSTGVVPDFPYSMEKRAYGNSFAIYALAEFYKISQDPEVLELAKKSFLWLDQHAHDDEFGGYFQYLTSDGTPIPRSVLEEGYDADDKALVGLKDYNSSIHVMEALSALYQVWPDGTLRSRLEEMFEIISEIMLDDRGFLKLHFTPDWREVSDQDLIDIVGEGHFYTNHITFGHDVETAFLLIEANEVLGKELSDILPLAKRIVDHSLAHGWDNEKGGFYEQGRYEDGKMVILDSSKNWWAQAEGLNSLLMMHYYFPEENYDDAFLLMLNYIQDNLIDGTNKGWYSFGIDHRPEFKKADKAQIWKGNYHTVRSLLHCLELIDEHGFKIEE